ncbi:MAG: response regulator transcription factor [Chloroflexi bacterium]|nr:response regulator transcription factor [Chloroflexota bacterium]MBM4452172.1 response regulator transcription factor [Chloroflexota bacterium]
MNKRILVVEDDPSTLRFIEYTLQQEGLEIFLAKNGLDGLKIAQTEHPDLIILDIMLPGLDGYEVCRRLRQKSDTANILVLMLSAKARQEDKDMGMKMGADDYLSKPVDPTEIINKVQSMLMGTGKVSFKER